MDVGLGRGWHWGREVGGGGLFIPGDYVGSESTDRERAYRGTRGRRRAARGCGRTSPTWPIPTPRRRAATRCGSRARRARRCSPRPAATRRSGREVGVITVRNRAPARRAGRHGWAPASRAASSTGRWRSSPATPTRSRTPARSRRRRATASCSRWGCRPGRLPVRDGRLRATTAPSCSPGPIRSTSRWARRRRRPASTTASPRPAASSTTGARFLPDRRPLPSVTAPAAASASAAAGRPSARTAARSALRRICAKPKRLSRKRAKRRRQLAKAAKRCKAAKRAYKKRWSSSRSA